jgi:fatty acid synthase, animal type
LTTQNNPTSGILGLVKCLKRETGGDLIRCIFDPTGEINLDSLLPEENLILKGILEKDLLMNIFEDGVWGSYRHIPTKMADASVHSKTVEHAYVNTLVTGNLSSLHWIESPLQFHKFKNENPTEKFCTVHYSALNFKGQIDTNEHNS